MSVLLRKIIYTGQKMSGNKYWYPLLDIVCLNLISLNASLHILPPMALVEPSQKVQAHIKKSKDIYFCFSTSEEETK